MFWTAQVFHILGVKNIARIKGSSTNIYLCGLLLLFHKYEYGLIHVYILTGLVLFGCYNIMILVLLGLARI